MNEDEAKEILGLEKEAKKILGLGEDTSEEAVKTAYRKLIRENHPDKAIDKDAATARAQKINGAKEFFDENAQKINEAKEYLIKNPPKPNPNDKKANSNTNTSPGATSNQSSSTQDSNTNTQPGETSNQSSSKQDSNNESREQQSSNLPPSNTGRTDRTDRTEARAKTATPQAKAKVVNHYNNFYDSKIRAEQSDSQEITEFKEGQDATASRGKYEGLPNSWDAADGSTGLAFDAEDSKAECVHQMANGGVDHGFVITDAQGRALGHAKGDGSGLFYGSPGNPDPAIPYPKYPPATKLSHEWPKPQQQQQQAITNGPMKEAKTASANPVEKNNTAASVQGKTAESTNDLLTHYNDYYNTKKSTNSEKYNGFPKVEDMPNGSKKLGFESDEDLAECMHQMASTSNEFVVKDAQGRALGHSKGDGTGLFYGSPGNPEPAVAYPKTTPVSKLNHEWPKAQQQQTITNGPKPVAPIGALDNSPKSKVLSNAVTKSTLEDSTTNHHHQLKNV